MQRVKRIAILGSTGSVGTQALKVIKAHSDKFEVELLCALNNFKLLIEQAIEFQPNAVVICNEQYYLAVKDALSTYPIKVYTGEKALLDTLSMATIDLCLNAIVGKAGLLPTVIAIQNKKNIALANKESLVVAGQIITNLVHKYGTTIIPVDSEHSAIFQCLSGEVSNVEKVILTASGGPFIHCTEDDLKNVTIEQALEHPSWKMGRKISVDSATLINKALEVIEAKYLFNLPSEQIEVSIHPKSIVHSLVQFADGSLKAQLGCPDMCVSIAFAFSYPQRLPLNTPRLDFASTLSLDFYPPNAIQRRALNVAYSVLRKGGVMPCVLNAANEVAVQAFLDGNLPFYRIIDTIENVLEKSDIYGEANNIEELMEIDKETRQLTLEILKTNNY